MTRSERARLRWENLTPAQQRAHVEKMQAGRRKANGPEALAKLEAKIDELGQEFKGIERGEPRRIEILRELQPLGAKRLAIAYKDSESEGVNA